MLRKGRDDALPGRADAELPLKPPDDEFALQPTCTDKDFLDLLNLDDLRLIASDGGGISEQLENVLKQQGLRLHSKT